MHKGRHLRKRVLGVIRLLLGGLAGGSLLELLDVPAGMLLGSVVGAALVNQRWGGRLTPAVFPPFLRQLGFVAVGLAAGVLLTVESLVNTGSIAIPVTLAYLALGVLNLLFATILMARYGVDSVTAVLALTPGGLAEVSTIALEKDAQVGVVLSVHAVRLFTLVLVVLPILLVILT